MLDQQGRARPEISTLYNWYYTNQGYTLSDLEITRREGSEYTQRNAGFAHNVQCISVTEGKCDPTPLRLSLFELLTRG